MEAPILFRGKRKDGKGYVQGFYYTNGTEHFVFKTLRHLIEIEPNTRSINMKDPTRTKQVIKYYAPFKLGLRSYDIEAYAQLKVIGIQNDSN